MEFDVESLSSEEKLKLGTYSELSRISEHVLKENTLLGEFTIDKDAKELITELIWKKLKTYSEDMEAFAKHAKRMTINTEDVKLLARRNPSLLAHLSTVADDQLLAKEPKKKRVIQKIDLD